LNSASKNEPKSFGNSSWTQKRLKNADQCN